MSEPGVCSASTHFTSLTARDLRDFVSRGRVTSGTSGLTDDTMKRGETMAWTQRTNVVTMRILGAGLLNLEGMTRKSFRRLLRNIFYCLTKLRALWSPLTSRSVQECTMSNTFVSSNNTYVYDPMRHSELSIPLAEHRAASSPLDTNHLRYFNPMTQD